MIIKRLFCLLVSKKCLLCCDPPVEPFLMRSYNVFLFRNMENYPQVIWSSVSKDKISFVTGPKRHVGIIPMLMCFVY